MNSEYERRAEALQKLPRAERFDQLLSFPARFTFKAIGRGGRFADSVRELLVKMGYGGVVPVERPSANGKYLSMSFTLTMQSGQQIDDVYSGLESLAGLAYLI